MGNFNQVCAVSNTPIIEGQKARVFFLAMNVFEIHRKSLNGLFSTTFSSPSCHPYEHFKIVGYPALAIYNDNNQYEFIDSDIEALNLDVLNKIYQPNKIQEGKTLKDYNEYHDYLNIEKLESLSTVQNMISSGALRATVTHGITSIVMMSIHESIYQELILKEGWGDTAFDPEFKSFNDEVDFLYQKHLDNKGKYILEGDDYMLSEYLLKLKGVTEENIGKDDEDGVLVTKERVDERYKKANETAKSILIENSGQYVMKDHIAATKYQRDILFYDFPKKIIESAIGAKYTSNWFSMNNIEFRSPMVSFEDVNYLKEKMKLNKIANIVEKLKNPHEEEFLELKEVSSSYYLLERQKFDDQVQVWFAGDDELIQKANDLIKRIEYYNIHKFTIGDNSFMDVFFNEHNFLFNYVKGTIIKFDF